MTTGKHVPWIAAAILLMAACGPAEGAPGDEGGEEVGTTEEALAPAGSNAQLVSSTIPASMYPGERRVVSVTMKNTGAASPANDWTASPQYALASLNGNVDWHYAYVGSTVPTGANTTFSFVVTAPPVSLPFSARMLAVTGGPFGDTVTVPITVSTAVTPQWGCTLVSTTLPAQLAPGENRVVTFTVRNTGTATWPATNLKLVTRDVPANLWGATGADLTTAVAPGGTATFAFSLKAPAAAGTYAIQRDMKDYAGIGDFRRSGLCVSTNVVVGGTAPLAATVVSQDFPAEVLTGEARVLSVVMKNTGNQAWAADGTYMLYSLNTPVNGWGRTLSNVSAATVSGGNAAFSLSLSVLLPPGTYHQKWQMRKVGGTDASFFGAVVDLPVTILDANIPAYDAIVVSQAVPATVPAGQDYPVTITVKNTGRTAWVATDVVLNNRGTASESAPTHTLASGETIGRNQVRTFSFSTRAPVTAGTYASVWQMNSARSGFFGEAARANVTVTKVPSGTACPVPSSFPSGEYRLQIVNEFSTIDESSPDTTSGQCYSERRTGGLSIAPGDDDNTFFTVRDFAAGEYSVLVTGEDGGILHLAGGGSIPPIATTPGSSSVTFDLDRSTGFITKYRARTSITAQTDENETVAEGTGWVTCAADTSGLSPAELPDAAFSPSTASACGAPHPAQTGCHYWSELLAPSAPATCAFRCPDSHLVACDSTPVTVSTSLFARQIATCCP